MEKKKKVIENVYIYHVLIDTGSTSLQFLFITDPESDICEQKYREIVFEVIIASEVYNRFDSSHQYWDRFNSRQEHLQKCLGCFSVENIGNDNACNPKKYFELFENNKINKKHKGIKKGSAGMNFENYINRIVSLIN